MKIKIEVTLDVNSEDWCLEYGTEPSEVRADVKAYGASVLREYFSDRGVLKS